MQAACCPPAPPVLIPTHRAIWRRIGDLARAFDRRPLRAMVSSPAEVRTPSAQGLAGELGDALARDIGLSEGDRERARMQVARDLNPRWW